MSDSDRISQVSRGRRVTVVAVLAVVGVLVLAFLADTLAASRAEHRLATAIAEAPEISQEPEVTLSGFPFLTRAGSGEFSTITVDALGVGIGDCGTVTRGQCTVTVRGQLADAVVGSVWDVAGDTSITAARLDAETRIDSVNLGRLMGITDLYLSTPAPEDKIGGGMPALVERTDGLMLSGTVPLPGSPEREGRYPPSASEYRAPTVQVSVTAHVTVVGGRVQIVADGFYDGPEEHFSDDVPEEFRSSVLKLFSTTLPGVPLAWNTHVSRAFARGSDLVLAGEQDHPRLTPATF